jgi:hypothetical protein
MNFVIALIVTGCLIMAVIIIGNLSYIYAKEWQQGKRND